ncbi:MAG: AAA family ATPase [Verrucomicrobiia bacterium]
MSEKLRITSIRFRNYKAFRDYSISLAPFNVLVGPNNAGKSTVLSFSAPSSVCPAFQNE